MSDPRAASGAEAVPPDDDRMRVAIELEIPSDVRYIERVVDTVVRQCADFHYPRRVCSLNVPVALTEALSNAILRGNGQSTEKQVRVRASVDTRELVMEVKDEGAGFDFDAKCVDPTSPERLLREDGRGLFLMLRLMDRVERFPADDQGNVVRLTLRRP
jgi:serine/threonine-protein kinase RsbW